MKHKYTIIYETNSLPICPDYFHGKLSDAVEKIKNDKKLYHMPGLHKFYITECGDWFPEEQKPMKFTVRINDVQSNTKRKVQREKNRSEYSK